MAVAFRAIGIAAKRIDADTFDATVEFVEVVDGGTPVPRSRQVYRVNTRPQLVERCREELQVMKADYLETKLTLSIANQQLAEVTAA